MILMLCHGLHEVLQGSDHCVPQQQAPSQDCGCLDIFCDSTLGGENVQHRSMQGDDDSLIQHIPAISGRSMNTCAQGDADSLVRDLRYV